jgi:choice-of-anchor B domain-containing protein
MSVLALGLAIGFAAAAAGLAAPCSAAASFNVEFADQLVLGPPETVTDVVVQGNRAFVGRGPAGLTIVDLTDPDALRVVGEFDLPGQLVVNDVQVAGDRAYLANESYNGVGVYILDVRNPALPQVIGAILQPLLNSAHNLWADGDFLYVVGHESVGGWRTRIFDVSDPLVPIQLAELGNVGAHDITLVGETLYEAGGWSGLHVWDVRDPAHPVHLAAADENQGPRPHYHTHSAWPTEDGRYVITMNELESWWGQGQIQAGGVKIWRWDDDGGLVLAATWRPEVAQGSPFVAAHNVAVRGRYAYLSYYQAGLRVLDLANPAAPVEVAFYDTYPGEPTALFQGAWGVDLAGGEQPVVLVSDRVGGLFALRVKRVVQAELAGSVRSAETGAPIPGALVRFLNAERTAVAGLDGSFAVMTGEGSHALAVSAPGFLTANLEVTLTAGLDPVPLRIELEPTGLVNGVPAANPMPAGTSRVTLGPAVPNPFRGATRIAYSIGAAAGGGLTVSHSIRLTVHDVAGRAVRNLRLPVAGAGDHQAEWDGRDEAGEPVPAGVYLLRLADGDQVRTSRVVLMR